MTHRLPLFSSRTLWKRIEVWTISPLILSAVVTIVTAPILLFYFHQVSFNGIVANLFAIPLISLLIPLMIFVVILPAGMAGFFYHGFLLVHQLLISWTDFCAELPFTYNFVRFSPLQFLLSGILLYAGVCLSKRYSKQAIIILPLFLTALAGVFLLSSPIDNLRLTFFDAGTADCALIETPSGQTIMIDSGPPETLPGHIKSTVLPYLRANGIGRIDWLLLTHRHIDHIGGAVYLSRQLVIDNILISEAFAETDVWQSIYTVLPTSTRIVILSDTMTFHLGEVKLLLLHPDRNYTHSDPNNLSLVARLDFREFSVLFTGDLSSDGENHLLTQYKEQLDTDILKLGHHGSDTASSPQFLEAVTPIAVFVPARIGNVHNLPSPEVINRLKNKGILSYIGGTDGSLQAFSDGFQMELTSIVTERDFSLNVVDD
ncbi:MAG: ComEC/Rec2 family competence protein [Candidatus Cloacimonetes bacterium]|nr:ComEC/Rec2 family competence protein [Candidatus Cloacimonadota bacterium]